MWTLTFVSFANSHFVVCFIFFSLFFSLQLPPSCSWSCNSCFHRKVCCKIELFMIEWLAKVVHYKKTGKMKRKNIWYGYDNYRKWERRDSERQTDRQPACPEIKHLPSAITHRTVRPDLNNFQLANLTIMEIDCHCQFSCCAQSSSGYKSIIEYSFHSPRGVLFSIYLSTKRRKQREQRYNTKSIIEPSPS